MSLGLMLTVGFQSCAASLGGGITGNETTSGAGAAGFLVALLFLLGGAFAIGFPIVSLIFSCLLHPLPWWQDLPQTSET
jgi:hypothetical protein